MFNTLISAVGIVAKFVQKHKLELLVAAEVGVGIAIVAHQDYKYHKAAEKARDIVNGPTRSMKQRAKDLVEDFRCTREFVRHWMRLGLLWHVAFLSVFCIKYHMSFFAAEKEVFEAYGLVGTIFAHLRFITFWPMWGFGGLAAMALM